MEIAIKSNFKFKLDTIRILSKNLLKFNEKYFLEILEHLRRRANFRRMRRRVTLLELSYAEPNYFLILLARTGHGGYNEGSTTSM